MCLLSCLSLLECFVFTWHPAGDVPLTCLHRGFSPSQEGGQIYFGRWDCLRVNRRHVFKNTVRYLLLYISVLSDIIISWNEQLCTKKVNSHRNISITHVADLENVQPLSSHYSLTLFRYRLEHTFQKLRLFPLA